MTSYYGKLKWQRLLIIFQAGNVSVNVTDIFLEFSLTLDKQIITDYWHHTICIRKSTFYICIGLIIHECHVTYFSVNCMQNTIDFNRSKEDTYTGFRIFSRLFFLNACWVYLSDIRKTQLNSSLYWYRQTSSSMPAVMLCHRPH